MLIFGGIGMKRLKRFTGILAAAVICLTSILTLAPVSAQAAPGTDIKLETITKALGDMLEYGVVAETYTQNGHAETSVMVDHLDRLTGDPFTTSGRAQGAATDLTVQADVTIFGAHGAISGMQFALFRLEGGNYVRVSDIQTAKNVPAKTATDEITEIKGIEFTVTDPDDKKEALYVMQVEDGEAVLNGAVNADRLVVQYGDEAGVLPMPITATYAKNHIGDISFGNPNADQNNINIMQGPGEMYSEGTRSASARGSISTN